MFNVINFITNTSNQYVANVVATVDNLSAAKVRYHNLCAALENADDVRYATVEIVNEYGNRVADFYEIIDHRAAAEPEPQEEPQEEVTEP
jgi:hypothetical protein